MGWSFVANSLGETPDLLPLCVYTEAKSIFESTALLFYNEHLRNFSIAPSREGLAPHGLAHWAHNAIDRTLRLPLVRTDFMDQLDSGKEISNFLTVCLEGITSIVISRLSKDVSPSQ